MKFKRLKNLFVNRNINSNPYSYVILGFLLILIVVIWGDRIYYRKCNDQIAGIKAILSDTRKKIDYFHRINGRYPESLSEFRQVANEGYPYFSSLDKMYINLTSKRQKNVPEYRELNNKGGYYYNPNTGEIRLNLAKPVREYIPFYYGKFKNQIPSEW